MKYLHQQLRQQPKELRQVSFQEDLIEWADRVIFWVCLVGAISLSILSFYFGMSS